MGPIYGRVLLLGLGRAAEKLANLCKVSFELGAVLNSVDRTIQSFLNAASSKIDPYGSSKVKRGDNGACSRSCSRTDSQDIARSEAASYQPETVAGCVSLATTVTMEIVSDRIKWKLGPPFDPLPFPSDPVVHSAYQQPDVLRLLKSDGPWMARAQVHCKRSELLQLAQKWDSLGARRLIPCDNVRREEAVGLFAVSKDQQYDRLIVNPAVINSRQLSYTNFTKTLAPGALVCLLRLAAHENLVISSDDLCEFYYTFPELLAMPLVWFSAIFVVMIPNGMVRNFGLFEHCGDRGWVGS